MADIDELEIQIISDSSGASNAVGNLTKKIELLTKSLTGLSSADFTALTAKLDKLGESLGASAENFAKTANSINGMANASPGIGGASKKLGNYTSFAKKATKQTHSLAAAFGRFYASYFLVIRGAKQMWKAVESSMNYVEILNYFDKATEQVAKNADLSQWESLGYESANAYYDSLLSGIRKRAEDVTAQMSGFSLSPSGELVNTGVQSLGISPSQLLNTQATFTQISSSMGATTEQAMVLSEVMTKLGADLASVKNLDFSETWKSLQSGLVGMSRTMDRFGVNIRNVNLQEKLTELGINANIQSLNQQDKALLRTIITLEATEYAWGDMADTIGQSANQMRLFRANLENAGRTLANLFLPVVQTVLPYLNGFVIAVQRTISWAGALAGIDMSGIFGNRGGGADNSAIGDILDDAENLSGALGDAATNAKKLKQQLQSFDEINNLSISDSAVGGISGIGSNLLNDAFMEQANKYLAVWQESFDKVENKAQKLADKIEKYFQPLKDIIVDIKMGDTFQLGQDVSKLVIGIMNWADQAVNSLDGKKIGTKIGDFLAGIEWQEIFTKALTLALDIGELLADVWLGSFKKAPLETAIATTFLMVNFTPIGSSIAKRIMGGMANELGKNGTSITSGWWEFLNKDLFEIAESKSILQKFMAFGVGIAGSITAGIAGWHIGQKFYTIITGEDLPGTFGEQMQMIKDSFTDGSWKEAFKLWGAESLGGIKQFGSDVFDWWENNMAKYFNGEFWEEKGEGIITGISNVFTNTFKKVKEIVTNMLDWIGDKFKIDLPYWYGLRDKEPSPGGGHREGTANTTTVNTGKVLLDWLKLPGFAGGGYPTSASLFWAGEHGTPELLGTVGGKTAVAGGAEITGISDAVYNTGETQARLMGTMVSLLEVIANKEFGISKRDLYNSVRESDRENFNRTGNSGFAY